MLRYWLEPVKEWTQSFQRAYNGIRNCDDWFFKLGAMIWSHICAFIIFPLFIIGQLFSRFFPLISLIYYNFDVKSVELLQWLLTGAYTVLIISWSIALINCIDYYHWTSHLLPGHQSYWRYMQKDAYLYPNLNLLQKYYNIRCDIKFIDIKRKEMVLKLLGKDIGGLVVSYWPKFDLKQMLNAIDQDFERIVPGDVLL